MVRADDGRDRGEGDHVVTAFLRNHGDVLLLRRSDAAGTYPGCWGGVSGYAEGDPDRQVRIEIDEETGLADAVAEVRAGRPVPVSDDSIGRDWVVHPYLFECRERTVELSEEHEAYEWVPATAIVDPDRETVPALWEAYQRVGPTVRSIVADDEHGAASLSIRALEVLRDRAGLLVDEREDDGGAPSAEWDELTELAGRLLEARPAMAVLRNRVNRAMATGSENGADAAAVLASTIDGIDRAVAADEEAAANASEGLRGTVLMHSRSDTVLGAIQSGTPTSVYVTESAPDGEGIGVAEDLASADHPVTVLPDAAAAHLLASGTVDRVVVGADAILPDGRVVNKTGTRSIAIAAAREDVPVTVVTASEKVSTRDAVNLESGPRSAVYDGEARLDVLNPVFDVTPAECVDEIVTERGILEPTAIGSVAEELSALADWDRVDRDGRDDE